MELTDLKRLQDEQFKILQSVQKICEKYDITYYGMYGTLIGAVRHGGTIPWDFDIDIAMTRSNFEKWLSVSNELDDNLFVIFDKEYEQVNEIRVANKNAVTYNKKDGFNPRHVYIDIFVIDYAKKKEGKQRETAKKIGKFLKLAKTTQDDFEKKVLKDSFASSKSKSLALSLASAYGKLFTPKQIEKQIYRMFISKEPTDYYIAAATFNFNYFYAEDLAEPDIVIYESGHIAIPKNYDRILKIFYGNYMEFPPENERYGPDFGDIVLEIKDEEGNILWKTK